MPDFYLSLRDQHLWYTKVCSQVWRIWVKRRRLHVPTYIQGAFWDTFFEYFLVHVFDYFVLTRFCSTALKRTSICDILKLVFYLSSRERWCAHRSDARFLFIFAHLWYTKVCSQVWQIGVKRRRLHVPTYVQGVFRATFFDSFLCTCFWLDFAPLA